MDIISVSELNAFIKRSLDREYMLKNCFISGSVINLKRHSSGHYYFSLMDDKASIDMVLWASTAQKKGLVGQLENGLVVTVRGAINFYEKTGRLSIICNDMMIGTKSAYQLAFEELKKELIALGYFDESHKQDIPEMVACIGIVTSSSGSVLHDILHVAKQRNPLVRFKLFSVPVQGADAGPVIAKGIEMADRDEEVELIMVGRGGGSMEDLWCFNDRRVVEAIYHAKTPIISTVGHETDYTLCDFAADVRGATPSHGAEIAVMPINILWQRLEEKNYYLQQYIKGELQDRRRQLQGTLHKKLALPLMTLLHQEQQILQRHTYALQDSCKRVIDEKQRELLALAQRLELANPLHMLVKGYGRIEKEGVPMKKASALRKGDPITITLQDGTVQATVEEVTVNG